MRILIILLVCGLVSCKSNSQKVSSKEETSEVKTDQNTELKEISFVNAQGETIEKIYKSKEEWASSLTKMEYYVLREKGTERPNTGDLLKNKKKGEYTCAACQLPLFGSDTKFESGTGWPSFYQPLDDSNILEDTDHDLGYARTEIMCRRCEGHLGHVFNDGPQPTGLRYCINSVSLKFMEK